MLVTLMLDWWRARVVGHAFRRAVARRCGKSDDAMRDEAVRLIVLGRV